LREGEEGIDQAKLFFHAILLYKYIFYRHLTKITEPWIPQQSDIK